MSCTLFAFMGFLFLMPLLCACLSLICSTFATQQKVDNVFMTYLWYWIKRMYQSEHFRQFLVICMDCILVVSVFLTIFSAYDNVQLRSCLSHVCAKRSMI